MTISGDITPWEPEETVGKLWHRLVGRGTAAVSHAEAAVTLTEMRPRIAVLFRGLGGDPSVAFKPIAAEESRHRLRWRQRLADPTERVARASFDAEALRLPPELAIFAERDLNASLYLWLAAAAAHAPVLPNHETTDPLRADLMALAAARDMTRATLAAAPGLAPRLRDMIAAHLATRQTGPLPGDEARVETLIRALLAETMGAPLTTSSADPALLAALDDATAPLPPAARGYRPYRPVPIWPDLRRVSRSAGGVVESLPPDTPIEGSSDEHDGPGRRARRHKTDQAERKDSIILYKFEGLLSWAQFLNINRRIEDDDPENAGKAADDQEELGLGQLKQAPATRLKLHLDLAPEDVDRERLSSRFTYPEWDARARAYLPDHCAVLAAKVTPADTPPEAAGPAERRRIREVRRRFEALAPARIIRHTQPDGDELDLDACLRAVADLRATGRGSDRIFSQSRTERRDLAVSILLDVSRSTESAVTGRPVIDIAREALSALAWGLHACGDSFAIQGFSSLRRDRVWLHDCKDFDEPMSSLIERRIHALRPGFYTRLGAAVRHTSAGLAKQVRARRLLIVITDGKPNDLDHYEGRHGIEDSAMAVREARRAGQAVFGITIDRDAQAWFPRIFGQGGFAVIRDPDRLTMALPDIYRHLVG